MSKNKQSDLFNETKPFPSNLFEIKKHEAITYFKDWYYIFYYHLQVFKDSKELTDEISKNIALDILEGDSLENIDDPETKIQERVDLEISHLIIHYFFIKQIEWFRNRDYKQNDIAAFLKDRKERINQVEFGDISKQLKAKIENAITYFQLIDEEIAKMLKIDLS